jgi:hypothetical protein
MPRKAVHAGTGAAGRTTNVVEYVEWTFIVNTQPNRSSCAVSSWGRLNVPLRVSGTPT